MRTQCTFCNEEGIRCEAEALHRIYLASDILDVCAEHFEEYKCFCWVQPVWDEEGKEIVQ